MGKKEFLQAVGFELITELRDQLERNGSVITGNLKRSISFEIENDELIIVMPYYGEYLEYGTQMHKIKPKNKKALKFKKGDKEVLVKEVIHPGTRPHPFIRPTFHQKLKGIINKNLRHL